MEKILSGLLFLVLLIIPLSVENKAVVDIVDFEDYFIYEENIRNINEYSEFKKQLGFRESTNRYYIVRSHYWGKYQLGKFARRELEINIDRSSFLLDTLAQEMALYELMEQNKDYLLPEFEMFIGDTINDIPITYAGLLASAHLVGYFSVKKYLHSDGKSIRLDGNNISMELYLEEFSEYDFELNENIKLYIKQKYGD